ncbi:GGDEF domain-containing protein [Actinotalea fermentans]|uniref:GGDEF domain-containing protein n=1 Tax=Actinotalea fermentans TaxID=43671 RepID=UPI0011BE75E1|nr:GGDEF domain-containing protein [Actinotalea fermentans]
MTLAAPTSSPATDPPTSVPGRLRTSLGRPSGVFPATRWLFARLALLSLAVTLPVPLLTANLVEAGAVLLGSGVLATSWTFGYLRGRTSVGADVADTIAVFAIALASDVPSSIVAALVSALWFRSLEGTATRAYLRPVAYSAALALALALWPHVGDHVSTTEGLQFLATVPMLFLTVVVARRLAWMFLERQVRDAVGAVYAAAIEQLLGLTDCAAIREVAAEADRGFCQAVPGLRIAKADADGQHLVIDVRHGDWVAPPERLPLALVGDVPAGDRPRERASAARPVADARLLDAAAGARCVWVALSLPVVPRLGARSWLLVGAPGAVPSSLIRALRNLANHMALAYAVAEAHDALTERATTDALTGLANRSAFTTALGGALADGSLAHVSVLFVDMDAFKEINDRLGHQAGDQVLREVATRLRRASRPGDTCGRLGGDEFAVLLPGADAKAAAIVAQRVAAAVRAPLRRAGDVVVPLSASVGCATAATGTDPEVLLREADAAMYDAKRVSR